MFTKMFFIITNLMMVANATFTNQTFQESCSGYKSVTNETFEYENITYEGAKFQITLPYKER